MSGAPHPQLVILSGPSRGDVLVLDDPLPVVFGTRSGISFPDPALAEVHCQVFQAADGRWFLQDFGAQAGTWVDGERVVGARPFEPPRKFRVGETWVGLTRPGAAGGDALEVGPATSAENDAAAARAEADASATDELELELPPAHGEPPAPLAPHDSLGEYDILEPLGSGSLGDVHKGYDRRRRRVVALKVLHPDLARDPKAVARFLRGAKAAARLRHPHAVRVYGAGHAGGRIYVTMEYVEGVSLERFCLGAGGRLAVPVAVGIAARLASALADAHEQGVVHRNVTPGNVLVGVGGFPKLADFARAKRARSGPARQAISQSDIKVAQTPYTPPELLVGDEATDERTDVYGLGATLFRALAGVPPFGLALDAIGGRMLRGAREDAATHRPELGPGLLALLERALAVDPKQRFGSLTSFHAALAAEHEAS